MTPALAEAKSDLLFNWGPRRRRKRSIASFLVASLVLHAFCFYLFQIIYPPTVSLLPPPGRVAVISPTTEEGRQVLRWIEAEDPAVASMTQRPAEAKAFMPPKIQHVPSYVGHQPALRTMPAAEPDLRVPDVHPPGPVQAPRDLNPSAQAAVATTIQFSPEFERLGAPQLPAKQFTSSSNEPAQAALFRVAAAPAGDVRYSIVQRSSGDNALDEQAREALALCRFSPIQNPKSKIQNELIWGTATVQWGNDIAQPTPAPSANGKTP